MLHLIFDFLVMIWCILTNVSMLRTQKTITDIMLKLHDQEKKTAQLHDENRWLHDRMMDMSKQIASILRDLYRK